MYIFTVYCSMHSKKEIIPGNCLENQHCDPEMGITQQKIPPHTLVRFGLRSAIFSCRELRSAASSVVCRGYQVKSCRHAPPQALLSWVVMVFHPFVCKGHVCFQHISAFFDKSSWCNILNIKGACLKSTEELRWFQQPFTCYFAWWSGLNFELHFFSLSDAVGFSRVFL